MGALILTVIVAIMYFSSPGFLHIGHSKNVYAPSLYESCLLFSGSALTIFLVWNNEDERDINRYLKLLFAAIPFVFIAYICAGYFFGLNI